MISMLLEDMVGKNSGGSPKIENLASISEVPGDVSGELSSTGYSASG